MKGIFSLLCASLLSTKSRLVSSFNSNNAASYSSLHMAIRPSTVLYIGNGDEMRSNGDDSLDTTLIGNAAPNEVCGESCFIVDYHDTEAFHQQQVETLDETENSRVIDNIIRYVPVVVPLVSYLMYESVADSFSWLLDAISNKNWETVDGNMYESRIIAPAINGVVVPAIAILFATLISNTVTTLRQRQLDIRTSLNTEAGELRVLSAMVDSFPKGLAQEKCRLYLIQYTTRLIAESQPAVDLNSLELAGSMDSEMNGFIGQLNELATECSRCGTILPSALLSETYGAVNRLNYERSIRISALQSTFPYLHYAILSALAASLCTAFLMETNQDLLIFLNAIQLRLLWSMLIGTFAALGVVSYDLQDPFRGSYQISRTVDQFYTIRSALCASAKAANRSQRPTL